MPPVKKYNSYLPMTTCTTEARLNLSLLAGLTGNSPASIIRDAWEEYCASKTIAALLKQAHGKQPEETDAEHRAQCSDIRNLIRR